MPSASFPSLSELRGEARSSLSGDWGRAIAVCLIPVLASLALHYLGAIGALIELLVAGPLAVGSALFFLSIVRRRESPIGMIFDGFQHFNKALGLYLLIALLVLLWSLLLIIPGIVAAYRYSQAYYILADNPQIGILEALDRSKQLMTGYKWRLFLLHLSFIGWMILSVFTFGIILIWLTPYMKAATTVFYQHLLSDNAPPPFQ